ncbi:MAG: hypothetical protein HZB15_14150 [Actinobacteria bacterium]|nr:hypothetical protein [Actinomycetota bacterium]
MIDIGLLASIAIVLTVPTIFLEPWPADAVNTGVLDISLGALFIGLAVGRVVALAIDDPGSLTSVSDLIIIRSGVEFWPGVLAGLAWLAIQAIRSKVPVAVRLAALVPAGLVAWACYEATCLLRDGCPGPVSSVGIRPDGLATRMFPVGIAVAIAAVGIAVALDRFHRRGLASHHVVMLALLAVAAIRAVASIWLPHIGDGLTRQHRESIIVAALAVGLLVTLRVRDRPPAPTVGAT